MTILCVSVVCNVVLAGLLFISQYDCLYEYDILADINKYMPWTALQQVRQLESNVWIRMTAPQLVAESRLVVSGIVSTAGAGAVFLLGKRYPALVEVLAEMVKARRDSRSNSVHDQSVCSSVAHFARRPSRVRRIVDSAAAHPVPSYSLVHNLSSDDDVTGHPTPCPPPMLWAGRGWKANGYSCCVRRPPHCKTRTRGDGDSYGVPIRICFKNDWY
jgi:hypothetical protein